METLVVVPRKKSELKPLQEMLRLSNKVKKVKIVKTEDSLTKKKAFAEAIVSESSLAKEWLSKEDNRWDNLLK
ncbi:MAG: hypothetical protein LH473_04640 [Chitinophagales bacterium]|nr:hypothetical protein [Chitinophagales bacterium]